jgi:hypothetical protein
MKLFLLNNSFSQDLSQIQFHLIIIINEAIRLTINTLKLPKRAGCYHLPTTIQVFFCFTLHASLPLFVLFQMARSRWIFGMLRCLQVLLNQSAVVAFAAHMGDEVCIVAHAQNGVKSGKV